LYSVGFTGRPSVGFLPIVVGRQGPSVCQLGLRPEHQPHSKAKPWGRRLLDRIKAPADSADCRGGAVQTALLQETHSEGFHLQAQRRPRPSLLKRPKIFGRGAWQLLRALADHAENLLPRLGFPHALPSLRRSNLRPWRPRYIWLGAVYHRFYAEALCLAPSDSPCATSQCGKATASDAFPPLSALAFLILDSNHVLEAASSRVTSCSLKRSRQNLTQHGRLCVENCAACAPGSKPKWRHVNLKCHKVATSPWDKKVCPLLKNSE